MRYYSLRKHALWAFLLPLTATVIAIIALTAFVSYRNIAQMRDTEMEQDAAVLAMLFEHEAMEGDRAGESSTAPFPSQLKQGRIEFRITSAAGKIFESSGLPPVPETARAGFQNIDAHGQSWRLLRWSDSEHTMVDVAEPLTLRRSLALDVMTVVVVPLIALALAIAFIVSVRIDAALRPVARLSDDLDSRDADDLRAIDGYPLPIEIRSMAEALNGLLGRLHASFEREREFSDNAAHELRTPLAVLKTSAQLIERRLADNPALAGELRDFVNAVDRAANVIDRMLELARLASPSAQPADFNISLVVGDVSRDLALLAVQKGLEVGADIASGVVVHGSEDALRGAVRNIIENAIKFTPRDGNIRVVLEARGPFARFFVEDDGVGIAPGEEKAIFQRFRRSDKNVAGAGLGLALVEKAVRLHHGRAFAVRRDTGGVVVGFDVPRASNSFPRRVATQNHSRARSPSSPQTLP